MFNAEELLLQGLEILKWVILAVSALLGMWLAKPFVKIFIWPFNKTLSTSTAAVISIVGRILFSALFVTTIANLIGIEVGAFGGLFLIAITTLVVISSQGIIGNAIYGMAIQSRGWFKVGDWVEVGGIEGRVTGSDAFSLQITTVDYEVISIPWSIVISESITNISVMGVSPIEALIHIPGEFDLMLAILNMQETLGNFQSNEALEWGSRTNTAVTKLVRSTGVQYPYLTYASIEGDSKLFRCYAIVEHGDMRVVDAKRGELLRWLDIGLSNIGIEVGQTSDNTNVLSGRLELVRNEHDSVTVKPDEGNNSGSNGFDQDPPKGGSESRGGDGDGWGEARKSKGKQKTKKEEEGEAAG